MSVHIWQPLPGMRSVQAAVTANGADTKRQHEQRAKLLSGVPENASRQCAGRAGARRHEVPRGRDGVGEGVVLGHAAAALVPELPQLAAAAHGRDRVDEAAVQQRNRVRVPLRIERAPIRACRVSKSELG